MKFNTRKCWNNKNSKKKHRERHRFSLASVWTIFSNQRIVSKVCEFYSKANRNTVRREWKMIKTLWYIRLKFHHSDTTSKAAYEMSFVNLCDKKSRMRFTTFSIKAYMSALDECVGIFGVPELPQNQACFRVEAFFGIT